MLNIADHALFEIGRNSGELKFKASPNYEDPKDSFGEEGDRVTVTGTTDPTDTMEAAAAKDNVYHVTVKAEVLDQLSPRDAVYLDSQGHSGQRERAAGVPQGHGYPEDK